MTGRPHRVEQCGRLDRGGRIDRGRPIVFTFEGRRLTGFAGDTLASALLANGVKIVGRSFKYHRPRGFLSAGAEEPNGLVTLGEGGRRTPNVAATTVELHEGLVAARQNGWPSADFDLMALTGLAAPFFEAGFYYKTFMGPGRRGWMLYEPFIRRAAGLGRGGHARDPDRYEVRHAYTDVLVIGGGPAGLAAARAAAATGLRVCLVEQDFALGGSLLATPADSSHEIWRAGLEETLRAQPKVELRIRTSAFGVYDGNSVALIERRDQARPDPARGLAREIVVMMRAPAIVYATGAAERPLLFADNDRPGVMLASAVRTYVNRFAVAPGRRAVVATNNDGAWRTAFDLAAAGVAVTVLDERKAVAPALLESAQRCGVAPRLDARIARARGRRALCGVEFLVG
ncbi:MAG TPA: FAD-dependent oxidoreductase, partial [Steroidobacteraceae bacterium]|nr:FAD-dependent oxidoreductase [Steroidobacteraceae bacterium]